MAGIKIDLFKQFKAEYKAGAKPALVDTTEALYLGVEGHGAPGGEDFQGAIEALYAMAYTMKMGRKKNGQGDYAIGKLEGIYWSADDRPLEGMEPADWCWQLQIRTPESVDGFPITDEDLATARGRLAERGKDGGSEKVGLFRLDEGRCVQMLHVGPYEREHETLAVMREFCETEKLIPHGRHHEIYLSDPRRVEPERLKTILRIPVK